MGRKKRDKLFVKPNIKYHKQPDLCQKVKEKYLKLKKDPFFNQRKIFSQISSEHGVKQTTLRYWAKQWETDVSWSPMNTENHGTFHRVFTDEQEKSMVEYIEDNYIEPHNYFSNSQFQTLAFEAYDNIYRNQENPPNFCCSKNYISKFKNKYDISSRLAHFKERDIKISQDDMSEEIALFRSNIQTIIEEAQKNGEPVLNGDETGFQILPNSIKTWAFKGTKNIAINTNANVKDRISIMATISANMEKLPLFLIGKGNSIEEAMEQVGELNEPNKLSYSYKSYMTTNCFLEYLEFLRDQFNSNVRIHLIIDSYSSHKTERVKQKANELNIVLYYIPSGMTDILQPLDIAVFAPLKSITNGKIASYIFGNKIDSITMKTTIQLIQESYNCLSVDNLINAWNQYL